MRGGLADTGCMTTTVHDLDAAPASLLTFTNPKVNRGESRGYLTTILHLAPERLSGRNVCPHATAGCRAACLNTAGRGGIGLDADGLNTIQVARIRRTRLFHSDRETFLSRLVGELEWHVVRAGRHGLAPVARLNGTSDLPWERFPVKRGGRMFPHVFAAFPEIRFYDYTKWPVRLRRIAGIENYSLTFSLAESNDSHAADALERGVNVAVVFDVNARRKDPLPASAMIGGRIAPVVDGDVTDLRFLDAAGVIVGLRAKGSAVNDRTGFVRSA